MNIVLILPGGVHQSGEQDVIPAFLWLIEALAKRHHVLVVALHQHEHFSTLSAERGHGRLLGSHGQLTIPA